MQNCHPRGEGTPPRSADSYRSGGCNPAGRRRPLSKQNESRYSHSVPEITGAPAGAPAFAEKGDKEVVSTSISKGTGKTVRKEGGLEQSVLKLDRCLRVCWSQPTVTEADCQS